LPQRQNNEHLLMIVPAARGLNLRATGRRENCGALLALLDS
jgi:hypothetical protein